LSFYDLQLIQTVSQPIKKNLQSPLYNQTFINWITIEGVHEPPAKGEKKQNYVEYKSHRLDMFTVKKEINMDEQDEQQSIWPIRTDSQNPNTGSFYAHSNPFNLAPNFIPCFILLWF